MAPKKTPLAKKLLLIGVPLALAQAAYIFVFQDSSPPLSMKEAINEQISKNNSIPADRKELVKVQVALSGYRVKNGAYPNKLNDLVPDYLDTVPLNPETGAAFEYSVQDDRYSLGEPVTINRVATAGKSTSKSADETDADSKLIAYLDTGEEGEPFVYDPSNKRDPFRSFDFEPQKVSGAGATDLEQFAYNDLKLSAVLEGFGEPKAIIEDPKGKGHTVSVGTKVGNLGGTVMKIESDKLIILEKSVEFTGETQTRTVEMYIR